jgi:hypothetical protein
MLMESVMTGKPPNYKIAQPQEACKWCTWSTYSIKNEHWYCEKFELVVELNGVCDDFERATY